MSNETKPRKRSSVRHTRAVQRAYTTRQNATPPDDQIAERLTEVVPLATLGQVATFPQMGLRARLLTLPVILAFGVSLIWQQLGSVCEAVRVLPHAGMRWCTPLQVSQQASEQRLKGLPAALVHAVLREVLPPMQPCWAERTHPLLPELVWARQHFTAVLALDGSRLDQRLRTCGLLREGSGPVLGGGRAALLDGCGHLLRAW